MDTFLFSISAITKERYTAQVQASHPLQSVIDLNSREVTDAKDPFQDVIHLLEAPRTGQSQLSDCDPGAFVVTALGLHVQQTDFMSLAFLIDPFGC
jgi:hypothetical protein